MMRRISQLACSSRIQNKSVGLWNCKLGPSPTLRVHQLSLPVHKQMNTDFLSVRQFSAETKELDINEFHRQADATLDALCERYEEELESIIKGDFDATYSVSLACIHHDDLNRMVYFN